MEKPKVSTITPCFRMKKYLKKFLEELPKQTYFENLEVVLDHNEPDEEELGWVKEFQQKYPGKLKHFIINPVEQIGASMNRCIKEGSGEFVTIWNVDDLRTNDSIELQVKALVEKKGDIAYGDYIVVRSFGSIEGKRVEHAHIPATELTRSMITGPFVMFRKSLCDKVGYFDEQLRSGADFDLSLRLCFGGKGVMTDGNLGYYLNEGMGASTRPNSRQPIDRTAIEVRYGIYDKIDYDYISYLKEFDIANIIQFGQRIPVKNLVPEYDSILNKRKDEWFQKGLWNFAWRKIFMVKKIRATAKKFVNAVR